MNLFERIRVKGFRRLVDVDLPLKPLNVLIGANGSGKTSLLDVFSLLSASAEGDLQKSLANMGGIVGNISTLDMVASGKSDDMRFELDLTRADAAPLAYSLALRPQGITCEIIEESLTQQQDAEPQPFEYIQRQLGSVRYYSPVQQAMWQSNWHDSSETALSQVPRDVPVPTHFRRRLAASTHYHALDVGSRASIRLPQQMRDAKLPGGDGEDLVSCLYGIRETDGDRFETIEDTLRAGFPSFERLNFPPVAAGMLAMTWKDRSSKHPFYMHQLSEGTLRFLWLVTLLQSPGLTALTIVDEPEVSLHPELLSLLAELMREASQRTQLVVATHADRLVRFLQPSEVVAFDVGEDGAASAKRADEFDIDEWLGEYTLDEVWSLGRIGGRS